MAVFSATQKIGISILAGYYALWFLFRLVVIFLTNPTKKFWEVKNRKIPKALIYPEIGKHRYIQLKTIKIHYVEAGDQSKPLMLFLHGFPEFWYSWRHQLKEFSKDYWCVAVDLRGYGGSSKPDKVTDYKIPLIVEDIKELIEALGQEKFYLIAHDWGGVVAWSFLDLYAEIVEKYVIMNAPHSEAWDRLMEVDNTQFSKAWYVIFFQIPYLPELFVRLNDLKFFDEIFPFGPNQRCPNNEDLEIFKFMFSAPNALVKPIHYYRNLFTTEPTKKRVIEKDPAGLFLFGDEDVALSLKYVDIMPQIVPNLTSKIIKGAGHYVQQDKPIAVNEEIRKFLQ